jgi:hypothetical protein
MIINCECIKYNKTNFSHICKPHCPRNRAMVGVAFLCWPLNLLEARGGNKDYLYWIMRKSMGYGNQGDDVSL